MIDKLRITWVYPKAPYPEQGTIYKNEALLPKTYLWIDAILIKETPKAILIVFDGKKIWLPKAWIVKINRNRDDNTAKIKISEYYWTIKSQ